MRITTKISEKKTPRFEVVPPRMTILSDHPVDDVADEAKVVQLPDNLELASRLSAIFDILRHKETRCPLTVAVYGDWGTGKTSAMKWLEGKLNEWNCINDDRDGGHPNVHPVWFEPWKYHTREDVWRGIIAEVILAMLTVNVHDKEHLVNGLKEAAKKFGSFLGRSFLHALKNFKYRFGDAKLSQLEVSGEVFQDVYDEWHKTTHPQEPYLNQFEATLADWVVRFLPRRTETNGGIRVVRSDRIVLFIDDLDRCLPEVTLEVLEAIKLYLSINPLIFVCGLDRTVVDAVVKKRYQDHGLGDGHKSEHYLNKIFQVEVDVAPSETQVRAFLDLTLGSMNLQTGQYLDDMLGGTEFADLAEEEVAATARERLHSGLGHLARHNPREIKRLLNSALLRGRMAADNLRLHSTARKLYADQKLAPAIESLQLPEHESGLQPLLFAQGVSIYLLQRHFESPHQLGRESASYLFRTRLFLIWMEKLSRFLCQHLAFTPPNRHNAVTKQDGSSNYGLDVNEEVVTEDPVLLEYSRILSERPTLEQGVRFHIACVEGAMVYSLLRIPFSAEVAQSTPSPVLGVAAPSEDALLKLSLVLRNAMLEELERPESELLVPADLLRVEKLVFGTDVIDQDLDGIQFVSNLKNVDLSFNDIGDKALIQLAKLPELTHLELDETNVSDAGMMKISQLSELSSLNVSGTSVSDAGLSHLSKLSKLTDLNLAGTNVGDPGAMSLIKLSKLVSLNLSGTKVSDECVEQLSKLQCLVNLNLGGTQVGDSGMAFLKNFPQLTSIALNRTNLTDIGVKRLVELSGLDNVNLSTTHISDAAIAALSKLQKLTSLNLSGNQIGDSQLEFLAKIPNLSILILSGTQVSDSGLEQLAKITQLTSLNLARTQVSDVGLGHLEKLLNLKTLSLSRMQGSKIARDRLRTINSGLHIRSLGS